MSEEKKEKTASVSKEASKKKSRISLQDFWDFFKNTSALGLAVAVVMADSVNKLVESIVNGLITPFLSLFLPKAGFEELNIKIFESTFKLGTVLSSLINFFVISGLIYLFVKGILRQDKLLPGPVKKAKAKVSPTLSM